MCAPGALWSDAGLFAATFLAVPPAFPWEAATAASPQRVLLGGGGAGHSSTWLGQALLTPPPWPAVPHPLGPEEMRRTLRARADAACRREGEVAVAVTKGAASPLLAYSRPQLLALRERGAERPAGLLLDHPELSQPLPHSAPSSPAAQTPAAAPAIAERTAQAADAAAAAPALRSAPAGDGAGAGVEVEARRRRCYCSRELLALRTAPACAAPPSEALQRAVALLLEAVAVAPVPAKRQQQQQQPPRTAPDAAAVQSAPPAAPPSPLPLPFPYTSLWPSDLVTADTADTPAPNDAWPERSFLQDVAALPAIAAALRPPQPHHRNVPLTFACRAHLASFSALVESSELQDLDTPEGVNAPFTPGTNPLPPLLLLRGERRSGDGHVTVTRLTRCAEEEDAAFLLSAMAAGALAEGGDEGQVVGWGCCVHGCGPYLPLWVRAAYEEHGEAGCASAQLFVCLDVVRTSKGAACLEAYDLRSLAPLCFRIN